MKKLLTLAIPLIISQLVAQLLVFTDVWMMAQMSILAIAGGGLGASVYSFVFIIAGSTVGCVANLIAIAYGKRVRQPDAGNTEIRTAVKGGILLSLLLTVTLQPFFVMLKDWLLMADQDPQAVALAMDYINALKWSMLPTLMLLVLRSLVSAFGDTRSIMVMSVATVILNVPISYVLAFKMDMGIAGLGYGSSLASLIIMVVYGHWVFNRDRYRQFSPFSKLHEYRLGTIKPLLAIGVPIMIATLLEHALFSGGALLAGTLGAVSLAIHQIAMQCLNLSWNIAFGFSQAASILVSQHFGRGEPNMVRQYAKQGLFVVTATSAVIGLFLIIWPEFLTQVFSIEGDVMAQELVAALPAVMIMVALCFIVDAWQLTAISVLRGMKVVIAPTISTVIGYWLIGLPAAWLLMKLMGVKGVWAGFAVGLAATGLMLVILLFKSLTRFENQIRKQNDEDAHNHSKSANVATKTLTVL